MSFVLRQVKVQGRIGYAQFSTHYKKDWRTLIKFFAHIMTLDDMPVMAQRILTEAAVRESTTATEKYNYMVVAVHRTLFDKDVLREDNWLTEPALPPTEPEEDENGNAVRDQNPLGTHYIGKKVWWERSEAIVLAFIRDADIGDLWKIKWVDEADTCDLEHGELMKGLRAWDKRAERKRKAGSDEPGGSSGYQFKKSKARTGDPDYVVPGIEGGIVFACSLHPEARSDVFWPARIMHYEERKGMLALSSSKKKNQAVSVNVVFFAPYWTSSAVHASGYAFAPSSFHFESVDANKKMIQKYPHETDHLDIEQLRMNFALTGLAKNHFKCYVDAHRLALAFKKFGASIDSPAASTNQPQLQEVASLSNCHIMSLKTPLFPTGLLDLPWTYILSRLDVPSMTAGSNGKEPILNLRGMLNSMEHPFSSSPGGAADNEGVGDGVRANSRSGDASEGKPTSPEAVPLVKGPIQSLKMDMFINGHLHNCMTKVDDMSDNHCPPEMQMLGYEFVKVLDFCNVFISFKLNSMKEEKEIDADVAASYLKRLLSDILLIKGRGEDAIVNVFDRTSLRKLRPYLWGWRKACEQLFSYMRRVFSSKTIGIGVCTILTDKMCSTHLTASGSMERSVRLPAALKGARNAGAGVTGDFQVQHTAEENWVDLAINKVLPMVHEKRYISRLAEKVKNIKDDNERGVPLTDDSDGKGGDDTGGSKGSFDAAVCGVACALKGAYMVCNGLSVNVFCATRPPGHHAGTNLRAFKASSNGFCLLNSAAAAAKYAVLSMKEGGLGLKRVCIIDFDVHHGNGTQEILCKTYDPRFLYISMHAGNVSKDDNSDDDDEDGSTGRKRDNDDEIFPGKSGNSSPHAGVLNIPMGGKVTASEVGQALHVSVNNAVEAFHPDLMILSAGFDAHKNDPLGLGGLTAQDFASITDLCCRMAEFHCSGRVVSILEGGYGVPCCKFSTLHNNLFLPPSYKDAGAGGGGGAASTSSGAAAQSLITADSRIVQVSEATRAKIGWLDSSDVSALDDMPVSQIRNLLKCAQEGFVECVENHCRSLKKGAERFTCKDKGKAKGGKAKAKGKGKGKG